MKRWSSRFKNTRTTKRGLLIIIFMVSVNRAAQVRFAMFTKPSKIQVKYVPSPIILSWDWVTRKVDELSLLRLTFSKISVKTLTCFSWLNPSNIGMRQWAILDQHFRIIPIPNFDISIFRFCVGMRTAKAWHVALQSLILFLNSPPFGSSSIQIICVQLWRVAYKFIPKHKLHNKPEE